MGTSTHNGGQKGGTPLVPSWLQDPDENMQNETEESYDVLFQPDSSALHQADRIFGKSAGSRL